MHTTLGAPREGPLMGISSEEEAAQKACLVMPREPAQVRENESQHLVLVEGHGPHLLGSPSPLLLLPKAHRAACYSQTRY